jgi:hypothetical protein
MKKLFVLLFILISFANAEYYKINVKKVDNNLYKDTNSGTIIETQFCFEFASFGEEAILRYDSYSYDNKIIFKNGNTCDVKRVLK